MKKKIFTYLLTLISFGVFAQKTIENPEYGLTSLPGEITKIDLLENETVLHFHLEYQPYGSIIIPKKSFLVDNATGKKFFTTKSEGIPLSKNYTLPENGQVDYKIFFPKIPKNIKLIDFKEGNNPRAWFVYDLNIDAEHNSLLPKEIKGSWYQTNGSELCDYIFTHNNAIVNKQVWNYKKVKAKKNKYTIVLEKNGIIKKLKAKLDKEGVLIIKNDKTNKAFYSKEIIHNNKLSIKEDIALETPIIKADTATYSGIIKNYTPRLGIKTGMVYVNNALSGEQESYIIKITDDGSFSVKIPVTHPQFVLSRAFKNNKYIFIEPGKETFHVIDGRNNLFMGDLAQINTDLDKMSKFRINGINKKVRENILKTKPEDYKAIITKQHTKALSKIEELTKRSFISKKALELKKLSLKYANLRDGLAYDMYTGSAKRKLKPEELKDLPNYQLDKTYLSGINAEILNNPKALMTEGYDSFINYLSYLDVFSNKNYTRVTPNDILKHLQKQNIEVSKEQIEAIKANEILSTPEKQKRQDIFNEKHQQRLGLFYRSNGVLLKKIKKENPKGDQFQILRNQLKETGKLSPLDEEMLIAYDKIKTPEEKEAETNFQKKHGEALEEFNSKNSDLYNKLSRKNYYKSIQDNMKNILDIDSCLVFDIITLNNNTKVLTTDLIPYSDEELKHIKKEIINTNIASYLNIENNRTKAKLEANKTKTGYNVNKVEKTEGDELFEAMIAKFKGKVIYVDFWATWCAPCRSGMKRIAPLKEKMIDKDVVFLYISSYTSPEKTWKNSIPNIKGEHYRVTQDEWNYLTSKFKITGIPHYALVNKKGELVKSKLGHMQNTEIKKLLETELSK